MAWSTGQLARLAGVSLRSIRHWHDVGLLPQPIRLSNGYKQYSGRHLVLSFRIARLSRLGFSLERIGEMLESEDHGKNALMQLRDELAQRIADLEQLMAEATELIELDGSPDLSSTALLALDALGDGPGSRDIAIVMSQLISREDTAKIVEATNDATPDFDAVSDEFAHLPADSSEATILALAARVAAGARGVIDSHGDSLPAMDARYSAGASNEILLAVAEESMNPAQQRVMRLAFKEFE